MDTLPTYGEATSKQDWLSLVVSFVPISSWTSCCLVDRRFYNHFAPRLWQDPLVIIRQLGLHPNDDISWYKRFIYKYARPARLDVRCMVRSLDFRSFALSASGLYSTEASERAISESFRTLPQIFPMLACLLLGEHPELDPGSLATARDSTTQSLELLDLARCRQELTSKFFCPPFFRNLVYLDISYVPGSLRSAIQSSLNPVYLPSLRVLKAQGREVDDSTARLLCQTFGLQLWGLDLSENKLTDDTIDALLAHCFLSLSLRSDSHFEVEGKVIMPKPLGNRQYGPFEFIQESSQSSLFTHPERYLTDAPVYSPRIDRDDLWEWRAVRSDGTGPLRRDEADAMKKILLQNQLASTNITPPHFSLGGITHLSLNGNSFSTDALGKLLRLSSGRLEHFECDHCIHILPQTSSGEGQRGLRVRGIFGLSHLFRPVISSNLRSLRAHHSLVTRVPDILTEGLSPAMALRWSETIFFKKISRVYPQRFVPDMNPRIASLTLTDIPARSVGPVIEQITSFLDLASSQQKAIRRERLNATSGRHTTVLSGLRHIRLELDSDFSDDVSDVTTGDYIDYDKLLNPGDEDFGSDAFTLSPNTSEVISNKSKNVQGAARNETFNTNAERFSHWTSGRLKSAPYSDTESQFVIYREESSKSWAGSVYSVPVWIGPGTIGSHAAVNEYMWNLQNPTLRTDVRPATPSHVAAGVPALAYIFCAAWDAMAFPNNRTAATRIRDAGPLRDVAAAIKDYRTRTRGTPNYWDGKIELVRESQSSRYHASEYWR
ncbi:hypothetical protein F4861DRAFT_163452 [Xylaria intraflava]|nr:hypothetical protein F4861DRAFT_163452 [Xylaria intraflava]